VVFIYICINRRREGERKRVKATKKDGNKG
jgi:hypothetical protein